MPRPAVTPPFATHQLQREVADPSFDAPQTRWPEGTAEGTARVVVRVEAERVHLLRCRDAEECGAFLRVQVHDRLCESPLLLVARDYALPPRAPARGGRHSRAPDVDVVCAEVDVPIACAPDAYVGVSLHVRRDPGPRAAYGEAVPGNSLYVGRAVFPVRGLFSKATAGKGEGEGEGEEERPPGCSSPPAYRAMRADVFPVGTAVCCEAIEHRAVDARLRVGARVVEASMPPGPHACALWSPAFPPPPCGYVDVLARGGEVDAWSKACETRAVRRRMSIGSSRACPEGVRSYWRMMQDHFMLCGCWFHLAPTVATSAISSDAATTEAFFRSALVWREASEGTLRAWALRAQRGGLGWPPALGEARDVDALVLQLLTRPQDVPPRLLLDLELGRLESPAESAGERWKEGELAALLALVLCGMTHLAVYCPDEVQRPVCGHAPARDPNPNPSCAPDLARRARRTRREGAYHYEYVMSDQYSGYVGGNGGYRGDCDDLQHPLMAEFHAFRASRAPAPSEGGEHVLVGRTRAVAQLYACFSANGMAWAAKAGDPLPSSPEYGKVQADGLRAGVQGHMFAVMVPLAPDGNLPHMVLEGTTAFDARFRPNPQGDDLGGLLGASVPRLRERFNLGGDSAQGYPCAGSPPFYDSVCSLGGPSLARAARGRTPGYVCVDAVATVLDGETGERRIGVDIATFLDPAKYLAAGVEVTCVGEVRGEDVEEAVSLTRMLPGKVKPPAAPAPRRGVGRLSAHPPVARFLDLVDRTPGLRMPAAVADFSRVGTIALKTRSVCVTRAWADELAAALAKAPGVLGVSAYVDTRFADLEGLVVVVLLDTAKTE